MPKYFANLFALIICAVVGNQVVEHSRELPCSQIETKELEGKLDKNSLDLSKAD